MSASRREDLPSCGSAGSARLTAHSGSAVRKTSSPGSRHHADGVLRSVFFLLLPPSSFLLPPSSFLLSPVPSCCFPKGICHASCWKPKRKMRTLRRFFKRLSSRATTRQDEERLRAEIEEHLALQTAENVRAGLSHVEARRQAVLKFGGVEAIEGKLSRPERTAVSGNTGTGYASGAAALANGPGVHHRHDPDAGAGHRRDHVDIHAGACRSAEVAAGCESRRTVPPGKRNPLLLHGRVQSGWRVFPCLVRFVQILQRQHQRLFRISGLPGVCAAVWCAARGQPGSSRKLSGRVRLRQLLRDVRHPSLCRTHADRPRTIGPALRQSR